MGLLEFTHKILYYRPALSHYASIYAHITILKDIRDRTNEPHCSSTVLQHL
jgi:hypothetical protein